jgi:hypothetical protein
VIVPSLKRRSIPSIFLLLITTSRLKQGKAETVKICNVIKLRLEVGYIKKPEIMISLSVVRNYLRFSSEPASSVSKGMLYVYLSRRG